MAIRGEPVSEGGRELPGSGLDAGGDGRFQVATEMTGTDRSADEALSGLTALAPVDGRYWKSTRSLVGYFSESALMRHRLEVETEYFLALLTELNVAVPSATAAGLRAGYRDWELGDARQVKRIEERTAHDVKAIEYFFKERVGRSDLSAHVEKVHLGLTSEDVNNLAQAQMHGRALHEVLLPAIGKLILRLATLVERERATPMLARTHGQPATPTTVGKEIGVFLSRLCEVTAPLLEMRLPGKLAGATGTYGALVFAYPSRDWPDFARRFVTGLGLRFSPVVTQIEPHDGLANFYDTLRHAANVLIDLCQDMWQYVALGYFNQRPAEHEVGSSTMPHKVNPIDFENAEGNLQLAAALTGFFSDKLTRSRMQRDLSDSTVLRNAGLAFAHFMVALEALGRGLGKVEPDAAALAQDLAGHPEVLAEAYQTFLRAEGWVTPYERLKELTRGRVVTLDDLHAWVQSLDLSKEDRMRLVELTPKRYVGLAPAIALEALGIAERWQARLDEREDPA